MTQVAGASQCHITNDLGVRCTAEVLDPMEKLGLCTKHTAALLEYAIRIKARIITKEKS